MLALLVVWSTLFAPELFEAKLFVWGDAPMYHPFQEFSRDRWAREHQRTFWNPFVLAGLPAVASLADSRPQYLPDVLLDGLDAVDRIPRWPPLAAPLLAHLSGMIAAALLARALWGCGAAGMLVAGVSWGLMPNLVAPLAFGHDAQFFSGSLIPIVLLFTHALFGAARADRAAAAGLALAGVLGIQCLVGHPQIILYSGTLATLLALERAARFGRPRRLAAFAAAAILGAAIAAAMWGPAALYIAHTSRAVGLSTAMQVGQYSLAGRDLLGLLWPWAAGYSRPTYWGGLQRLDYPMYLGITACTLAVVGLFRHARDTRVAVMLAVVGGVAVALAMGTYLGWLHEFLSSAVPFWSLVRVPVAVLIVTQAVVALLAARALAPTPVPESPRRTWGAGRIVVVAGLIVLLAVGLALAIGPFSGRYGSAMLAARPGWQEKDALLVARHAGWDLMLRVLLCGAALMAIAGRRWQRLAPVAGVAAMVLVTMDLGPTLWPLLRQAEGPREALHHPAGELARLGATDPSYRVLPLLRAEFYTNDWVGWRVRSLGGEHGSYPIWWSDILSSGLLARPDMLRALSVRWFSDVSTARWDTSDCAPVGSPIGPAQIWQLRRSLPRAHSVARVVAVATDAAVFDSLATDFDARAVAFTSEPQAAGEYGQCETQWVEDSPDRLILDAIATNRGFVLVADAWFPGWTASVDGVSTRIFRVDHMLRGVIVPPGRHRVVIAYSPSVLLHK